jgi:pSer/pThr/pTyr-binding forkhead associated (FHA) protein
MQFEILSGPEDGTVKTFAQQKITLGRGDRDFSFPYAWMVSNRHAEAEVRDHGYSLTDTKSANGTVIIRSGQSVALVPKEAVSLAPGDIIVLGKSIWLKFLGA